MLNVHAIAVWIFPILHQPKGEGKKVLIVIASEGWAFSNAAANA